MRCCKALPLSVMVLVALAAPRLTADLDSDQQVLLDAGLGGDGASLLQFFRCRCRVGTDQDELQALAKQLGNAAVESRERAAAQLIAYGPVAIPILRHALNDLENPAAATMARRCLQWIEGKSAPLLSAAAVRLLAKHKPAGAVEALLAYLPWADDPLVVVEVTAALQGLAFTENKAHPALREALHDPVPLRRAVAGEALARRDQPDQLPAVRELLRDPKPLVRLRAALALAKQQDVESIPVLIDLLGELAVTERQQAEEVLQLLAGEWAPLPALRGNDDVSRRIRRDAWAAWWRHTDGPALIAEFRKHTLSPAERAKVLELIQKLADNRFVVREQASIELIAYGSTAAPLLRQAAKSKDAEQAHRAEDCLRRLALAEDGQLATAAPRLLALRKPPRAVEVLLEYVPFAESDLMIVELQNALASLALQDGKPEPALVRALSDPIPLRRALAAEALSHTGPAQRQSLHKLLQDNEPLVRGRVARALALVGDREAIPVLIELMTSASGEHGVMAQEILSTLAGDRAPVRPAAEDKAALQKWRSAWGAWWREQGREADLGQLTASNRLLGLTLIVEFTGNANSRVSEVGRDGKLLWTIENLQLAIDARVLNGNRVLVAEYNGRRVSERDFKGEILWKVDNLPGQPVNVQRLANGNTFIVLLNNQVLEVDRTGKTVFSKPIQGINAANRLANGHIVCLTSQGMCMRLDASGKELGSFNMGFGAAGIGSIDVLLNGHVLTTNGRQIVEFDAEGKKVWEANAPESTSAVRLPNGNTLYASHSTQRIVELDRAGKMLWEHKTSLNVHRARRR